MPSRSTRRRLLRFRRTSAHAPGINSITTGYPLMPAKKKTAIVDLTRLTEPDLLQTWGRVMVELRDRGVISSANSPIADVAERVAVDHFGGRLAPPNTKGYDVKVGSKRLQVKGIRIAGRRRTNLSAIRSDQYDSVIVVVFDELARVSEILELGKRWVPECCRWSNHVNAYLPSLSKVRQHPKVKRKAIKKRWR